MSLPSVSAIRPLDHLALRGADEAPALVLREGTYSYKDLRDRVATMAGWLQAQVPQRGARIATWAAKGELTCLMPLAAARAILAPPAFDAAWAAGGVTPLERLIEQALQG